jgi:transcription initiation factor TFIIH subunit 2
VEVVKGLASLQNTILLAMATLKYTPSYGYRELLILFNSLSTCDPSDIFATIEEAKRLKIRISIICLTAEVFICRRICELTGGTFSVAMDPVHLKELMFTHTVPPPELLDGTQSSSNVTDFIYMGFPKLMFDPHPSMAFEGKQRTKHCQTFQCPRCWTRTTDIPTVCCVCGLQLNSSSHIARSYHHLFPVPNFIEYTVSVQASERDSEGEGERYVAVMSEPSAGTERDMTITEDSERMDVGEEESEGEEESKAVPMKEEHAVKKNVLLEDENIRCRGCLQLIAQTEKLVFRCPRCVHFFCVECDLFIHDSLHNCPGCDV